MYRENGCFVLTCHPFVIGRASRIALLEDLVTYMRRSRGVWFTTGEEVARWHASGPAARPPRGPAATRRASAGGFAGGGARSGARGPGRR